MWAELFRNGPKHTRLAQNESECQDTDTLLPPSSSSSLTLKTVSLDRSNRDLRIAMKTFVVCTIVYLAVALTIAWSMHKSVLVTDPDEFCLHHVSLYSPVVKEVKPNWHTKLFNGTFLHENAYRQSAGPEVDAAWEALGVNYRSIVVSADEAERTGLRHDQVQVSEEYGGGFPANVEGLHHLHCLNLLRKALYWNYDYYVAKKEGPFVNSPYIVWWQPDDETNPMPFVDFNTKHRCRDYEAVRVWAEAHQLPPEKEINMSRFYEMPKPGDAVLSAIP